MAMRFDDIDFMWNGGETRRYHGFRMLMEDTVGHHSFNVACIIMKVRPDASARLLRAALKHDIAEHKVGDMPAPSKRAAPDYVIYSNDHGPKREIGRQSFREWFGSYEESVADDHGVSLEGDDLTPEESWVLKFADSLDGMRFCINEMLLGNRTPRLFMCYETFAGYVATLLWGPEPISPLEMIGRTAALPATDTDKALYMEMRRRAYNAQHS